MPESPVTKPGSNRTVPTKADSRHDEPSDASAGPEVQSIERLAHALETLSRLNIVRLNGSLLRMSWVQFVRGLFFGLGSVMGATILVSVLALMLSRIEFLPIIGDWAAQIAREIQAISRAP